MVEHVVEELMSNIVEIQPFELPYYGITNETVIKMVERAGRSGNLYILDEGDVIAVYKMYNSLKKTSPTEPISEVTCLHSLFFVYDDIIYTPQIAKSRSYNVADIFSNSTNPIFPFPGNVIRIPTPDFDTHFLLRNAIYFARHIRDYDINITRGISGVKTHNNSAFALEEMLVERRVLEPETEVITDVSIETFESPIFNIGVGSSILTIKSYGIFSETPEKLEVIRINRYEIENPTLNIKDYSFRAHKLTGHMEGNSNFVVDSTDVMVQNSKYCNYSRFEKGGSSTANFKCDRKIETFHEFSEILKRGIVNQMSSIPSSS